MVVPVKYDHVNGFDENGFAKVGAIVGVNGNLNINKFGLINKQGDEIVPVKFDDIELFDHIKLPAVAVITNNNKSGLINAEGKY